MSQEWRWNKVFHPHVDLTDSSGFSKGTRLFEMLYLFAVALPFKPLQSFFCLIWPGLNKSRPDTLKPVLLALPQLGVGPPSPPFRSRASWLAAGTMPPIHLLSQAVGKVGSSMIFGTSLKNQIGMGHGRCIATFCKYSSWADWGFSSRYCHRVSPTTRHFLGKTMQKKHAKTT